MIKQKFRKVTSLFMAALMCVTTMASIGSTTAYAATGEKADVYLVDYPRSGDANYSGNWGHSNLTFMNGWHSGTSKYTDLKAIGSYSGNIAYGCPYIQENCDVEKPSDNLIIYGHNMNNGSMFAGLMKFKDKSFWEKHKTISFDTLTDHYDYEVVAVFKTFVYSNSPESFKYYQFSDAETKSDFDEYIRKCKELALYDTGVTAEYGDKLISLSTCEYSRTNGRLVVVAKRVVK